MKTILHATDFSDNSVVALKYAYELSMKAKAKLHVIHITNLAMLSANLIEPYYVPVKENLHQKNEKLKEFCLDHLGAKFDGKKITAEALENNYVVDGVVLKANELEASIIVTGMKGSNILKDFIIGDVTKELIEKAPCPVLAIPNKASLNQIKTIVYATDFEEEDVSAIFELTEIAALFDATIKIVHVSTDKNFDSWDKLEWFKGLLKQKVSFTKIEYEVLFSEEIFTVLYDYLLKENADIIGMLEREKKGLFKKIFHRDLVKKMESVSAIPLISFNEINYQYS